MRFAVESWAPEYGIAADPQQMDEAAGTIDAAVEVRLADWRPVDPDLGTALPERLLFVDGVRRIDARVWITDADERGATHVGVCASVAAGAVLCTPGRATVAQVEVRRGLFTMASDSTVSIATAHGDYTLQPCPGDTPEDLYLGIHEQMTALESELATDHDADLVVFDGPLRGRRDPFGIGYVKTQHVHYLPEDVRHVLTALAVGQRTPLFQFGGRGSARFSWYLRLPGPRAQPLSGIVRCELSAAGTVAQAAERADAVSLTLPRFASAPHKDPRAPQNLYPIAGLEQQLRHRLGDAQVLERALRRAAAT